MPFLRDEGPPVSKETLEEARRSLPLEYGWKFVNERGRGVIVVRVPHPKPDYLHELTEVALYVPLEQVKLAKDVLLVGDEKVCRLEPLLLRDHIRERANEDGQVVQDLSRKLDRNYGMTVVDHKFNMSQHSIAVRIPRAGVADMTQDDLQKIRAVLQPYHGRLRETQAAYVVADGDFERLGRRVFLELVDPDAAKAVPKAPDNVLQRPGVVLDKFRQNAPSVTPSGGMGGVTGAPHTAPPGLASQVFTAPPPSPLPLMKGTGTTFEAGLRAQMPTDPATRQFVEKALGTSAPQAAPPAAAPERTFVHTESTKEYEVMVAKPKGESPPAPPAAAPPSSPQPQPAPAREAPGTVHFDARPAAHAENAPAPGFVQTVHHDEYEVFVSKRSDPEAKGIERAKEGLTDIVAAAARPPTLGPSNDSGQPTMVQFQAPPVAARANVPDATVGLDRLAGQLEAAGYRVVRGLEVEGTSFELAAHRDGGKRVLAKSLASVDAAQVKSLATVAERLGADACLAISAEVAPGARLAAWGTHVEIVTPRELDGFAV